MSGSHHPSTMVAQLGGEADGWCRCLPVGAATFVLGYNLAATPHNLEMCPPLMLQETDIQKSSTPPTSSPLLPFLGGLDFDRYFLQNTSSFLRLFVCFFFVFPVTRDWQAALPLNVP